MKKDEEQAYYKDYVDNRGSAATSSLGEQLQQALNRAAAEQEGESASESVDDVEHEETETSEVSVAGTEDQVDDSSSEDQNTED